MAATERIIGLVQGAQRGDGLAMAELLDELAPAVGRWCGPIALQDSQDAAQEALIVIFRRLGSLRQPAALFGWARAIAVREAVRVARRSGRERPAELADLPARGDPLLASDVRQVLDRLPPEQRAVLMLRTWKASMSAPPEPSSTSLPARSSRACFVPAPTSGRSGRDELARG